MSHGKGVPAAGQLRQGCGENSAESAEGSRQSQVEFDRASMRGIRCR